MKKLIRTTLSLIFLVLLALFIEKDNLPNIDLNSLIPSSQNAETYTYTGDKYIVINQDIPEIDISDAYDDNGNVMEFENYYDLDTLGRAQGAYVCISRNTMPDYERASISMVKPTGWHLYNTKELWNITFSDDSFYLYNRCHIIGFQLTGIDGEHRSEYLRRNLFTGTRQLNVEGMLEFENQIASYLYKHPDGHVLYKAELDYSNINMLANGIHLQALSLDEELMFNIYIFNAQDGFTINYLTGIATKE